MKKWTCFLLASMVMESLTACGGSSDAGSKTAETVDEFSGKAAEDIDESAGKAAESVDESAGKMAEQIDVDLSSLSSTVVYSEVYNMMVGPEEYGGKRVRMTGTFGVYEGEERSYYSCLIADATACCSNGIEFVLSGDYSYPEDYPELGDTITVTGIFDTYIEGEYQYCQLIDAELDA